MCRVQPCKRRRTSASSASRMFSALAFCAIASLSAVRSGLMRASTSGFRAGASEGAFASTERSSLRLGQGSKVRAECNCLDWQQNTPWWGLLFPEMPYLSGAAALGLAAVYCYNTKHRQVDEECCWRQRLQRGMLRQGGSQHANGGRCWTARQCGPNMLQRGALIHAEWGVRNTTKAIKSNDSSGYNINARPVWGWEASNGICRNLFLAAAIIDVSKAMAISGADSTAEFYNKTLSDDLVCC